ncbi:MAG: alkaline phosphatase D family protein [Planctomycetes bacterium]|nr:alkaline phosphatase D family protein [Planctomycetota bacterium]
MIRQRWILASTSVLAFLVLSSVCKLTGAERIDVRITHGPILGRLSADGVGIWVRTSRPSAFRVRYGHSPQTLDSLFEGVDTTLSSDNTGWAWIKGLRSDTEYYYQVETSTGKTSDVLGGSFRTLPAAEDTRHERHNPRGLFNFSFEFACGNKPQFSDDGTPPRPTYVTMLRELENEIDFAILNGDWMYEVRRDYSVDAWRQQVGITPTDTPRLVRLAPDIVGVWENYKYYLDTDRNLATWHREIPSFFTFDDHEILNDITGTGEIGYRNARTLFRDVGIEAWYHYLGWSSFPEFTQGIWFGQAKLQAGSDVLIDTAADFSQLDLSQASNLHVHWGPNAGQGDANAGVYELIEVLDRHRVRIRPAAQADSTPPYSIGRRNYWRKRVSNCDFFFVDTRSERTLHDKMNPSKPGVSMLGRNQKHWLIDQMRASDGDFLFVVSTVNFMIPHVDPKGRSNKDEAWTSFLEEREELIDFWDGLNKPVFVLTGDLHNSFAIRITDRVWEFASGPHSSTNHSAPHEGNRPPNGPFQSGPRRCDIRWSSYVLGDLGRTARLPHYCVVQVNNVVRNPGVSDGQDRWIAFPRPHVIFRYYEGHTGRLAYAESIFVEK